MHSYEFFLSTRQTVSFYCLYRRSAFHHVIQRRMHMKKKSRIFALLAALLLTGCQDARSQTEAEQSVQDSLVDSQ